MLTGQRTRRVLNMYVHVSQPSTSTLTWIYAIKQPHTVLFVLCWWWWILLVEPCCLFTHTHQGSFTVSGELAFLHQCSHKKYGYNRPLPDYNKIHQQSDTRTCYTTPLHFFYKMHYEETNNSTHIINCNLTHWDLNEASIILKTTYSNMFFLIQCLCLE